MCVYSDDRTTPVNIPILAQTHDKVCAFYSLLAPSNNIVDLQIEVAFYAFLAHGGGVDFVKVDD